jgi:hypothetical protein
MHAGWGDGLKQWPSTSSMVVWCRSACVARHSASAAHALQRWWRGSRGRAGTLSSRWGLFFGGWMGGGWGGGGGAFRGI